MVNLKSNGLKSAPSLLSEHFIVAIQKALSWFRLIMHDWAHGATLDTNEINSERGVILEEKRLRNTAGLRMAISSMPTVSNNSQYAYRWPIGTEEVLKNFKPEVLKRFYNDWYRPDLQALIVVGDFNPR